ncbi:Holliday junction resolvase RecU [Mycoplasma suis]|uniref:Holliday junction resolvase RecU n=1 Tax=Mycoplasma suis (strain Illinois) TaxID=768700 RepID=F0QR25_MYCSL|nr:Holliday junction resolvase RecU [Mycoplasma suis]ADX97945.1 Holliday junction-specific endonuclease [Mycoplasma suis str. Illinois]
MGHLTFRNRGKILEELMLNTAEYYRANKIAYLRKTNPDYSHLSTSGKRGFEPSKSSFQVKLISKGDLDFYGVYSGKYFSIELKETKEENFKFSLIKKHQLTQMEEIDSCGGNAFLLIHFFHSKSSFWLITYSQLLLLKKKRGKLGIPELKEVNAFEIQITYPGILNLTPTWDLILRQSCLS